MPKNVEVALQLDSMWGLEGVKEEKFPDEHILSYSSPLILLWAFPTYFDILYVIALVFSKISSFPLQFPFIPTIM